MFSQDLNLFPNHSCAVCAQSCSSQEEMGPINIYDIFADICVPHQARSEAAAVERAVNRGPSPSLASMSTIVALGAAKSQRQRRAAPLEVRECDLPGPCSAPRHPGIAARCFHSPSPLVHPFLCFCPCLCCRMFWKRVPGMFRVQGTTPALTPPLRSTSTSQRCRGEPPYPSRVEPGMHSRH